MAKTHTNAVPGDTAAENQAIIDHLLSRKPLDPELARRIRERAESITQEIRQKHGLLDISLLFASFVTGNEVFDAF
jgi:hypothetical protein